MRVTIVVRAFVAGVLGLCFFAALPVSVFAEDIAAAPRSLAYITGSKSSIESLRRHAGSVDIVAPQAYAAKPNGTLLGSVTKSLMQTAYLSGASVMPLIVNQNFSQDGMHTLLLDEEAQNKLIAALIAEAKSNGYIGFQYDFEHMMDTDRDMYSTFVERSAALFHAAGLQISVAVSPRHSDDPAEYGAGSWENWTGAFDYARIGAAVDFVSVMAYDDSKSEGPAAALPWVEEVIDYSLSKMPAEKISLGVPFYFWGWHTASGKRERVGGYPAIAELLSSGSYLKKGWSDDFSVSYVTYMRRGKKLTAWYEDKRSFEAKLSLMRDKGLRGWSAWALGLEDPKIWDVVIAMRAPRYGLAQVVR